MTDPKPAKPDRTWLYVAASFVLFWVGCLVFIVPGIVSEEVSLEGTGGSKADYSWRLLDLDDRPVDFSRYKGKTVFLNVWATWCPPCVREMPSIAALASDPRVKDVAFVCVSTDFSSETVKQFLKGKNWPMTVLRADEMPRAFATSAIPATFLIAPDGRVEATLTGSIDWNQPKIVAALQNLTKPKL